MTGKAQKALTLVTVLDTGIIHWGPLDQYMKLFGVDEGTADEILDDVASEMEDAGKWVNVSGTMYDTATLEEYEAWEQEVEDEHQRYLDDIRAEWNRAKGV